MIEPDHDPIAAVRPDTAIGSAAAWLTAAEACRGVPATLTAAEAHNVAGFEMRVGLLLTETADDRWSWLTGTRVLAPDVEMALLVDPGPGVEAIQRAPMRAMVGWAFHMRLTPTGWMLAKLTRADVQLPPPGAAD